MKHYFFYILILLVFSCEKQRQDHAIVSEFKKVEQFQKMLDEIQLKGSILIYDLKKNIYYSNDFEWSKTRKLPASTYKIPNSIIALESEVVKDENTLFIWNGERRFLASWEQDLTFKEAFSRSCVPCYQDIARQIGSKRMNEFIDKFQYGDMQVDSTNIATFWLEGDSRISQFDQIDFLEKFYKSKLPISERTETIMKDIMIVKETKTYTLRGKTGWSVSNGINNGWFVGYVEKEDKTFFFATNVEPTGEFNQKAFIKNRKEITYKALRQLDILL